SPTHCPASPITFAPQRRRLIAPAAQSLPRDPLPGLYSFLRLTDSARRASPPLPIADSSLHRALQTAAQPIATVQQLHRSTSRAQPPSPLGFSQTSTVHPPSKTRSNLPQISLHIL
ncbi:hypothetical protein TIFTF001_052081, partial [Ficus carica]